MADKYLPERLRFLTEVVKQLFVILISTVAGIIILLRQETLTAMDKTLLVLGLGLILFLFIVIFRFVFQAVDTLGQIKSNDGP